MKFLIILLIAATAGIVDAQSTPAQAPTTRAAASRTTAPPQNNRPNRYRRNRQRNQPVDQQHPLQGDMSILMTRSIFMKGSQVTSQNNPTTGPAQQVTAAGRPEDSLVFNGFTDSDHAVAMIEDTSIHQVHLVHLNDSIASGKIVAIGFDTLDYQDSSGHVTQVPIGKTLAGGIPTVSTGPGDNTATPAVPAGPGSSVLERMMRRRQQGL